MTKKTIAAAAMQLSRQDRAELAEELFLSLDDGPIDPSIEQAWIEVAEQRTQEYLQGKVRLIPAAEAREMVRKSLQ